jgi:hypothetical protein
MAFAGKIPLLGLSLADIATPVLGAGIYLAGDSLRQALPQTGNAVVDSALGELAGGATSAVLNVGLGTLLGAQVASETGLDLTAGATFLQSQLGPLLSNTTSALVTSALDNALEDAGPIGPVLSSLAGSLTSNITSSIVSGIFGPPGGGGAAAAGAGAGSGASQPYPGAGGDGEGTADYGGKAYSLGSGGPDVVFSIRPATSPSQIEAAAAANNVPTAAVTVAADTATGTPTNETYLDEPATKALESTYDQVGIARATSFSEVFFQS